jgi:hypothetical protein
MSSNEAKTLKAPAVTEGEWIALPPFGKSFDDHGYRAVAKIERRTPVTIYTQASALEVEGRGCVWGDSAADAKMLAASKKLAEALAEMVRINRIREAAHNDGESFESTTKAVEALLLAGYTESSTPLNTERDV